MRPPPPRPRLTQPSVDEPERKGRSLLDDSRESTTPKPTKAFADAPNQMRRSNRRHRQQVIWGIVALIVIIGFGWYSFRYFQSAYLRITRSASEASQPSTTTESPSAEIEGVFGSSVVEMRDRVLSGFSRSRSGSAEFVIEEYSRVTNLGEVRTFSFSGELSRDGETFPIRIFAREPSRVRQVVRLGDKRIITVVDGLSGRVDTLVDGVGTVKSRPTSPVESATLLAISVMPTWFGFADLDYQWREGSSEDGDSDSQVLINREIPQIELHHRIDAATGLELKRIAMIAVGGEPLEVSAAFERFQKISDYLVPSRVVINNSGEPSSQIMIEIDDWSFNPGLLPSLFLIEP